MFPARAFAPRFFAPRYWPKVGAEAEADLGEDGFYHQKREVLLAGETWRGGDEWVYPLPSAIYFAVAPELWEAFPNAETEFLGAEDRRCAFNLTGMRYGRLVVNVLVPAVGGGSPVETPVLRVKYSLDAEATWNDLGMEARVDGAGLIRGDFAIPDVAARTEVSLSLWAAGGDDATAAEFGMIYLEPRTRTGG